MSRKPLFLAVVLLGLPAVCAAYSADSPDANGCWPASGDVQCCTDMPEPRPEACLAGGSAIGSSGVTGPVVGGIGAGAFQPKTFKPLGGSSSGGGGGGANTPKAAGSAPAGVASGDYTALMNRAPYIGTKEMPCRYGPTTGRCTHEGKPLPPPPPPDGFHVVPIGIQPFYGQTNHTIYPLRGAKWALKFVARPFGPFPVILESPNGFIARSAMEMFVSISEKPGDYDVSPLCLVLPDMLSNGRAGGAPHSAAQIEVSIGPGAGRCALVPGRTYYLNIAGDCSDYYSSGVELANARAAGCPTDLIEVNGWIHYLTPGGPAEYCAAKRGTAVGPDGVNCL